ncbi:hypothetical protein J3F84DRAFT_228227 [Trichoderma pleuroticola]
MHLCGMRWAVLPAIGALHPRYVQGCLELQSSPLQTTWLVLVQCTCAGLRGINRRETIKNASLQPAKKLRKLSCWKGPVLGYRLKSDAASPFVCAGLICMVLWRHGIATGVGQATERKHSVRLGVGDESQNDGFSRLLVH